MTNLPSYSWATGKVARSSVQYQYCTGNVYQFRVRKLSRRWNDAQLLENAQLVNIAPVFYRLAVRKTEDVHLVPADLPAGRRNTQELSPVRAVCRCVMHHLISLGYLH